MQPTIKPNDYFAVQKQVDHLINTYQSVNDPKTVQTMQALTIEKIQQILGETSEIFRKLSPFILDTTLTKARAERFFEEIKEHVIPFAPPSNKQVEKVFRKTKKLKIPDWESMDLRENSYIGWNDPGSQKKFILLYQEDQLTGVSGHLSPNHLKNICSICNHTATVALFLATTKESGDGTYTKKGNYICVDSQACNQQLYDLQALEQFVQRVKRK
ncbi:FusB/FusC family EF-G-binding protein [Enterococcus massiliensis]|uniref:FusB/FusC family EF-G-binding protein n=1 Tax=Enterococcus massiliensis TaxID=1640685 RepID=UPI00065E7DF6|nr:elongation factor G-binding protein [Enterococcus massiliensis]